MAFDKSKYDIEYAKEHITRKYLAFNKEDPKDCEILSFLEAKGQGNVNAYIKRLIVRDMHVEPLIYPPTRYTGGLYGCPVCKREITREDASCPGCGVIIDWK